MAGLNPTEKATVIGRIGEIHDEFGVVFLVIEHDLDAIRSISDTVIAMNEGRELVVGTPDSVMGNETVREAYIGA
jgi:branched-chain amino acid transport system ATP-binding protein